jgi:hypothetical protein
MAAAHLPCAVRHLALSARQVQSHVDASLFRLSCRVIVTLCHELDPHYHRASHVLVFLVELLNPSSLARDFIVASCVQLYIRHPPVSLSSLSNLVLPCSILSNPESRTLCKNKRGPCALFIKCSVEDFNRKSSSFCASSRNPKSRVKTEPAAWCSPSARQKARTSCATQVRFVKII